MVVVFQKLLSMLGMSPKQNFQGSATADESSFHYPAYSDSASADSRESIARRIWQDFSE
jgi:hypothetical protein